MTNFTKRMTIAAAALLAAAGMASAQHLTAEIPFTFRAGEASMAPGVYQVTTLKMSSGVAIYQFRSETSQTSLAVPTTSADPRKDWAADGKAKLLFECGANRC